MYLRRVVYYFSARVANWQVDDDDHNNKRLYFSKPDIEISGGSEKKNWTDRDKDCS